MAKRGPGEGTITRRKDGLWAAAVTLPGGKRRWFYAKTRAEVARKLKEAIAALDRGQLAADGRLSFREWATRWLESRKPELAPGTYLAYEQRLRVHILPALGRLSLARIAPQDLRDLYAIKRGEGLAPKTVQGIHLVIHGALQQALVDEIIGRNVAALAAPPAERAPEPAYFTTEQARAFLEAVAGDRHEALYHLAIATGLRLGELCGLRWADVDAEAELLNVRQQQRRDYRGWTMAPPKTEAGRRVVALAADTLAQLRAHRARQAAERLRAGAGWEDNDLVFPRPDGTPLHPHNFRVHEYYALLARAGLPRLRFHGLRHTFASLHLSMGTPLSVVSEMMGHSSVTITKDTYGHIELEAQRAAVEGLSEKIRRRRAESDGIVVPIDVDKPAEGAG